MELKFWSLRLGNSGLILVPVLGAIATLPLPSLALTVEESGTAGGSPATALAQLPVTSVDRLSDVQPSDWAFTALRSLIERYGVVTGYADGTFRGDRPLSRYEFAAALNTVLARLNEQIEAGLGDRLSADEVTIIQRLQTEFAAELSVLRGRVDQLEVRTATLTAQQFSTTTRLQGQVVMAVNAGGFEGDRLIDPNGAVLAEDDPNATFLYRAALDFNTSFTGNDLLKLRIDTGSNGPNDNATAVLEPFFGSILDVSNSPPSSDTWGVGRLFYTFSPLANLELLVGAAIVPTDLIDNNRYADLSFKDFSTEALVYNPLLFPISGVSTGAFADWNPGGGDFNLRALYVAADAANPGDTGRVRGLSPYVPLLYPSQVIPTQASDRGLFGASYQGMVELEYSPATAFALRLIYSGGEVVDRRFDTLGVNLEFSPVRRLGLFGRYGYSRFTDTAFGDIEPNYWMAGISVEGILDEGDRAGVAVGQPFIVQGVGTGTQTNIETFYDFPLNDNIRIAPVIQIITDSSNQASNGLILTGTLRTLFSF